MRRSVQRCLAGLLAGLAANVFGAELVIRDNIGRDGADEPVVWELAGAKGSLSLHRS